MEINKSSILHGTCVDIEGSGVLIIGSSGAGKSSLAIGLIALGAYLVADDQCEIKNVNTGLIISKPASLPESIEMRGIGLVSVPVVNQTHLNWIVNMDEVEEARMPDIRFTEISGHKIPTIFGKEMQDIAFRVYVLAKSDLY